MLHLTGIEVRTWVGSFLFAPGTKWLFVGAAAVGQRKRIHDSHRRAKDSGHRATG